MTAATSTSTSTNTATSPHGDDHQAPTDPEAAPPDTASDMSPDLVPDNAGDHLEQPAPAVDGELTAPALQAAARRAWLANQDLIGAELGPMFGRSERWGRDRITEARQSLTADTATAGTPALGGNGNDRTATARPSGNGNGSRQRQPHGNGTAATAAAARGRPAAVGARPPAASPTAGGEVPRSLVVVTVVAVAIVAAVTLVTSYSHTHHLARLAGQTDTLAMILPAAVDGLVIAGSTSLLVDHRASRKGDPFAWAAVVIGLASSLAANVVSVDPTVIDLRVVRWVMAGYAPVALAISGHLLLQMLGHAAGNDAKETR
jgi:hypothetical protein